MKCHNREDFNFEKQQLGIRTNGNKRTTLKRSNIVTVCVQCRTTHCQLGMHSQNIGVCISTKVGGSKSNLTLKTTFNSEVHFIFTNVPTMYILGGVAFKNHCAFASIFLN